MQHIHFNGLSEAGKKKKKKVVIKEKEVTEPYIVPVTAICDDCKRYFKPQYRKQRSCKFCRDHFWEIYGNGYK
jgi:Zn finger protein HypA/HybF involved in hydrogenase expression